MVLTGDMAAVLMPEGEYTSCIKINGIPILPPLITTERRLELQNYKKRAIDIEMRLKCQKDLKLFVENLASNNLRLETKKTLKHDSSYNNTIQSYTTLEHFLSFGSDESHINALGIPDIFKKSNQKLPSKDCKTVVPSIKQKSTNLTCNIFDVSEYSDNGVVIFKQYNKNEPREVERKLSASTVELDLSDAHCAGDTCSEVPGAILIQENECNKTFQSNIDTSNSKTSPGDKNKNFLSSTLLNTETHEELKPKPRLLRSNSYTLESPSPVLLEHFKKQAEQDPNNSYVFEKYTGPQRRSLDLGNCSHSSISFDSLASKTNDLTVVKSPMQDKNKSISSPQRNERISNNTVATGCDFICLENIGHIVQDLAQKHFGFVNEPQSPKITEVQDISYNTVDVNKGDDTFSLNSRVEEAEAALQEVLSSMPENCAKDIMELLERHKKEQEMKLKSYDTFKQKLFDQNVNLNGLAKDSTSIELSITKKIEDVPQYMEFDPLSPSPRNDKLEKQFSMATSGCDEINSFSYDSQAIVGLANSPTDTFNALNTSTPLLIDFESDSCDNESSVPFEHNSTCSNSDPLHVLRGYDDYQRLANNVQENKSPNCSRELFPDKPDKIQRKLREQWAATVLTAAAKGYLVRRLKRTERVKNLIQTIQDALLCAVSLHTESTESIHLPDVELHRRLIQQVSAACFEFYEVFFNLTTKEQMALIALDRQRLQERLKRPKSTSSLKINSSRSTPNSQRHSFNKMRQKKTLTPSFAA